MKFSLHLTHEDVREILHGYISRTYNCIRITREDVKIIIVTGTDTDDANVQISVIKEGSL